jgi:hypothetical protein
MNGPTQTRWFARLIFAGIAGALAIGAIATLPSPAQARVWVSVGGPCCYYGPGPYYGYPPPYYYAPPPGAYYPPPPPAGYPPPGYPAPGAAPSAYTPGAAPGVPGQAPAAGITYTNKPAFTNAAGQTCREYTTAGASGQAAYGTACQQPDGQWRTVN